ncbi:major facilitator superfamily domain-containing protein [Truncatella angustata]|uniref:Major facilitator superfamily domain-containing protein n=1 Tax=Truncatella angustata TaxID=152316 RepID=A0A9P8ZXE3_9PEZI|nr:major facilitator superfamily domain-containing protein [Truncatella angustata]KAH6652983.1 major facilitator superfamily domain-containing protein [Truncatella angustata]
MYILTKFSFFGKKAPVLPTMTSEFHTVDNTGWYFSAYLLAQMACQPLVGRMLLFYDPKRCYMVSIILFEVGSILCATSPTSVVFIFGRALAGCGAGGIVTASIGIYGSSAPMRERPRGIAIIAVLQSISYFSGPILSGAITESSLTWRFCFWINLPVGFVSLVAVFFVIKPRPSPHKHLPLREKFRKADPTGAALLTGSLVSLFLALEWGGTTLPFSSPQVWGCFLSCGLLAAVFAVSQVLKKDNAVIPLRIFKQRTVAVCCLYSLLYGVANIIHSSLLSTYFQTVQDVNITMSGVYYVPRTLSSLIGSVITGFTVTACGYYVPFLWAGPLFFLAGSVLLQHLGAESTMAQYLGYQTVVGFGFGVSIHMSIIAVQVVSSPEDMPLAAVMEVFSGQLGGAVGASIGQNLFVGQLKRRLRMVVPSDEAEAFASAGLTDMINSMKGFDVKTRESFRLALSDAVTTAFIVPIVATAAAAVVSWFVEWKTIDVSKPAAPKRSDVPTEASVNDTEKGTAKSSGT